MLKAKVTFVLMLSAMSTNAFSWQTVSSASIVELIQFEEGIGRNYSIAKFEDSSGNNVRCHIPYEESNLTSLVLALYMAGKKSTVHCHNESIDIGGYDSYRLHRVVAN